MQELERFTSLFDQEVIHTWEYLKDLGKEQWLAIPQDSETLFLGTRINKITISALVRHLIHAEQYWIEAIRTRPPGATIEVPGKPVELEGVADGAALIDAYRAAQERNRQVLRDLKPSDCEKEFVFTGRRYTGMGLLWSILGHHAYHLGQIDLLIRQQGMEALEYMEWPETSRVVG